MNDNTCSTYISQVEQWWQRSGLIIWQWSQYRMAYWRKITELLRHSATVLWWDFVFIMGLFKKPQLKVTIVSRRGAEITNCNQRWINASDSWTALNK